MWVGTECWVPSSRFVLDKHASATVLLPEDGHEKHQGDKYRPCSNTETKEAQVDCACQPIT